MKEFLEKTLNRDITVNDYPKDKLPVMFYGLYDIYEVVSGGFRWVMIKPKSKIDLRDMRNHYSRLAAYCDMDCGILFDSVSSYIKDILLEEGIPFVIEGKQVYLPFAGLAVSTGRKRNILPVHEISFLTQKILLSGIYGRWENMNVTEAAKAMNVSKTSVTRCFDEMEYLNFSILKSEGKSRKICIGRNLHKVWEEIKPNLRNPVIKEFGLKTEIPLEYKSGISALCSYSMLNDNPYTTFGVTKKEIGKIALKDNIAAAGEEVRCKVQEIGYAIDFAGAKQMDPLSVVLSLGSDELMDDRVELAVKEMLEEYVW